MPILATVIGGTVGSWAFRAGCAVGDSWRSTREREREAERRKQAARDAYNARRRARRAEKRLLITEARIIQPEPQTVMREAADMAVIESPAKTKRKRPTKTIVPQVPLTWAEPAAEDPISAQLMKRLGMEPFREIHHLGAWLITHHRPNPSPDRADKVIALASNDKEAFHQALRLAGVDRVMAMVEKLTWEHVGDPLTLVELLEALRFGKFEAETVEVALPLTPSVMRDLKGS